MCSMEVNRFSRNRQCLKDQREVVGETLRDIKGLEGLLPCCTSPSPSVLTMTKLILSEWFR